MTWCIWMKVPATEGWSRVAAGMSQEDAERFAKVLLFPARAMPDSEDATPQD